MREVNISKAVREFGDRDRAGYQIDVRELPADVYLIRFYNSW